MKGVLLSFRIHAWLRWSGTVHAPQVLFSWQGWRNAPSSTQSLHVSTQMEPGEEEPLNYIQVVFRTQKDVNDYFSWTLQKPLEKH